MGGGGGGYGYGGGPYGGNGYGGVGGLLGGKKVVPTFGVSFGLPIPANAYNGYPLNPYGGAPAQNPYFGSLSPNGLNLGLVNVNPLVSFQVAKNELGEKLFKPLVNLHVTPNANIIQKVGDLIKSKKFGFGNSNPTVNQHYHTHTHYPNPPEVYHPHHHEEHYPHHQGPSYPVGPSSVYPGSGPGGYPSAPGPYPSAPGSYPSAPGGYPNGPGAYPNRPGGYGYPSGQGYYRDGSSNNDNSYQDDYNSDNFYTGRNFNNVTTVDGSQNQAVYNYQDVYPQNHQLQANGPPHAYADYANYNSNLSNRQQSNSYNPTDGSEAKQDTNNSVSFPSSRRKRRSTNANTLPTKTSNVTYNENSTIEKVKYIKNDGLPKTDKNVHRQQEP